MSAPASGMTSAILRANAMYSSLGFSDCIRMRFQAIFRLCPATARFCCQPQPWSCDQSSWNRSFTNGLFA